MKKSLKMAMARKKVEKNLSSLHRAGEAAPKVPTDVAFRVSCFGEERRFWEEAEGFLPMENAPEVEAAKQSLVVLS